MFKLLRRYQKTIKDFLYSFVGYALPTAVIQFAVYPLVAQMLDSDGNGLFLALFNVVRLCVSVFIVPLANVRLLDKTKCAEEPDHDRAFNWVFVVMTALSVVITVLLSEFYLGGFRDLWAIFRVVLVLILLCAHDFFAIAFRVMINYKLILIDNLLIVAGYLVGLLLMWKFGYWELIFISGYLVGLVFVLMTSAFWKRGVGTRGAGGVVPRYAQLCVSSGLNNATVYCDKMLIYPMLGGHSVSVYNAAAVVSKVMSIVSAPLRNVLLSYIVDVEKLSVSKKKLKKILVLFVGGAFAVYGCFYLASIVLCRVLYPQFYKEAMIYVPVILLAILLETFSGIFKTVLLRFAKSGLQVLLSSVKIGVYLAGVVVLSVLLKLELGGFCFAILIADAAQFVIVMYHFIRKLNA